jgi:hypothetical protein
MRTAVTDDSATQPDAGAMADAERLMELAQAWVDAETRYENCTFTGTEDELIEEGRKCSAAEAAFRKALFAQPDAGAMVEATDDLVDRFAAALKAKLRAAEQKYGYSDDWLRDDWQGELIAKLLHHIQKGDPRDVAAYCAFAWHHGWSITPYTHANPRRAIRELKLIATAEVDPKVREGIDRAIQHLESMVQP